MRKATAELILKDPDRFAHHDRVFLNNPVVMQGMGLAPLVVLATTAHNGVMLAAAVTLLLVPSRVLACLLSRLFPLNSENPAPEELQKKLLPRALVYSLSASVVYLAAYPILNAMFGTSLLTLGIYLPLLVVEPLLTYRFGRVQETLHKAVSKGLRITVGYALLLMLLGCVREWLALGTVFGTPVGHRAVDYAAPVASIAIAMIITGSAGPCCPWPGCRRAALSCWACCAPCGVHWQPGARPIWYGKRAALWMCMHRRRRTASNERCCECLGGVLWLCGAGRVCPECHLYPRTGRVPSGAAGGG